MKRLLLLASMVVIVGSTLCAAPIVSLNGNMFIWVPAYVDRGSDNHAANLMRAQWASGAAGPLNQTFFTVACDVTGSPDYGGYMNMDLYKGNVLLAAPNSQVLGQTTMYLVNGATGASSVVWNGASDIGTRSKLTLDPGNGTKTLPDAYVVSMSGNTAAYFSDSSNNGTFAASEYHSLPSVGNAGFSAGYTLKQDAEFYGGWAFFTDRGNTTAGHWISRLNNVDNSAVVALADSAWPGWPGTGTATVTGLSYFDIKDINGNGHADIFAYWTGADAGTNTNNLIGHWEDLNNDLVFTSSEFVDSISVGINKRDVEVVSSGGNTMALVLATDGTVSYYNLLANGAFDHAGGGSGTLLAGSIGAVSDTEFMYLKMDQPDGSPVVLPEPGTMLLLGTGLLGLAGVLRRRFAK